MLRLTPLPLAVALLLILVPTAAAFPSAADSFRIRYDTASAAPMFLAAGALSVEGGAGQGFVGAHLADASLGPIPRLNILEVRNGMPGNTTYTDVTLMVHSGGLFWNPTSGHPLETRLASPAGLFVSLSSPGDGNQTGGNGTPGPSSNASGGYVMLVGHGIAGTVSVPGGKSQLLALDASVSLLDRTGTPIAGWDHRQVNQGGDPTKAIAEGNASFSGAMIEAEGAFASAWRSDVVALVPSRTTPFRLNVATADEDAFTAAMATLPRLAEGVMPKEGNQGSSGGAGGQQTSGGADGSDSMLPMIEKLAPTLNGAVVVISEGSGNATTSPVLEAVYGDAQVQPDPFLFARGGTLAARWTGQEIHLEGSPNVVVTRDGFAVPEPLAIGPVPLLSAVLWAAAVGALVLFFVRRPSKEKVPGTWRLGAALLHVVVLAGAFYLWDLSFAESFGTSALSTFGKALENGDWTTFAVVTGIELVPWSLAALLFALPVRIALGVGLRYWVGKKGLKGAAKAGGLVSLAILGPLYALWLMNGVLRSLLDYLPTTGS